MKKENTSTKLEFEKSAYTVNYIIANPSSFAKNYRSVWRVAVEEYLRRNKFEFNKKNLNKPLKNINFPQIARIFNTLLGKRNPPPRKEDSRK